MGPFSVVTSSSTASAGSISYEFKKDGTMSIKEEGTAGQTISWIIRAPTKRIKDFMIGTNPSQFESEEDFNYVLNDCILKALHEGQEFHITGPTTIPIQDIRTRKWRNVGCSGGEQMEYVGARLGGRDGVLFQFKPSGIRGVKNTEDTIAEISWKKHNSYINSREGLSPFDIIDDKIGTKSLQVIESSVEVKSVRERKEIEEAAKESGTELYGEAFGSWS